MYVNVCDLNSISTCINGFLHLTLRFFALIAPTVSCALFFIYCIKYFKYGYWSRDRTAFGLIATCAVSTYYR